MEQQPEAIIEFRKRGRRPLNRTAEEIKEKRAETNKQYYTKNQITLIEKSRAYTNNNREQVNERATQAYHAKKKTKCYRLNF